MRGAGRHRRAASYTAGIAALLLGAACSTEATAERPNVVVLLADDLGGADVGWKGAPIRTPRLDALAAAGADLRRFYVQPNCTPTRAAFLTGRYPIRYGLQGVLIRPWAEIGLPVEERTLAEALREAGYATALVGKWHLGHARVEMLPTSRGFESFYGCYSGAIDHDTHMRGGALDWHRDGRPLEEEGYDTDLIADEAVRIVREHDFERPLFLFVAFTAPHPPLTAPERWFEGYDDLPFEKRRALAAMVSCMDAAVGRIEDALDARGVSDDTLLLFFSDNGGSRADGSDNGVLFGGKGMPYEGGLRVPAFAVWPGRIPAGLAVDAPLHVCDLFPTLAGFTGARPGPLPLDGLDVGPTLSGGPPPERTELLLRLTEAEVGYLSGDWKLVRTAGRGLQLYDLSAGAREEQDVAREHPEVVRRLHARVEALRREAAPRLFAPLTRPPLDEIPAVWGPAPDERGTR